MPSDKTAVIEYIFQSHWNGSTLSKTVFSRPDVVTAIRYCNIAYGTNLSDGNAANFFKDLWRKSTASDNWPLSVTAAGYTGRQVTGNGNIFEFVKMPPGQTDPFPDIYKFDPSKGMPVVPVQSFSMLNESKTLGRRDESWLTQVAVKLGVVETHFAVASPLRLEIRDIIHLQMSMKLRLAEIDAFYMARLIRHDKMLSAAITCEAKQHDERVLESQVLEQARAAVTQGRFDLVVPIAMRAVKDKGIYIAEFAEVDAKTVSSYTAPRLVAESMLELVPGVPGI